MPLRDRSMAERVALAVLLPCVSGTVNAVCLLQLGVATSHMTGNATAFGEQLYLGQPGKVLAAALLLLCFFLGAFTASLIVDGGNLLGRGRYAAALFIEAAALATFGWMTDSPEYAIKIGNIGITGFVCFAMGIQNALVTRISGAVVRTTHLTGVITDLGIGSVRLLRLGFHNRKKLGRVPDLLRDEPTYGVFKLHFAILSSFVLGAAVGPLCLKELGNVRWLAVPLTMLLGLMLFDLFRGLNRADRSVGSPPPPPA